ncbi:MAG: sensor histidine kinase [Saprospiraceae bacterium]|nr:sensor histidine kinase [Saprospiraceae bacterium]
MIGKQIRFWNSIVSRFALFFTSLMVFVILLAGYLVFRKSSTAIIESGKERIRHSAQLAEKSFAGLLTEVSNDIGLISANQALRSFINDKENMNTDQVELLFKNVLTNKPNYFQIRLIDSTGQEIVRYDKTSDSIFQISKSDLQQKGQRDYFQEAMSINQGEYYFSRINLNEEYGVISDPPIATLRAASPLIDDQQINRGIVIINVDLNQFYSELTRISSSGIHFYLVDVDGQYLYTPDHQKEFGLQRGNGAIFKKDFSIDVTNQPLGDGSYDDPDGKHFLHFLSSIEFFRNQRKIYLMAALDESILLQSARSVRRESLESLAFVCLISLLMSYFFTKLFSKRINQVTKAMINYEDGTKSNGLPINRNDEIGMLARSFSAMRDKIDETMMHLNTSLKKEKQSKDQRDQLLQNMSHELRTPLHTIQGLSELLRKNKPTPSQVPIISSLNRSVQNLTGLVYDVLDHQKLIDGKLSLNLQSCNIQQLMKEIHQNYQYDALKKRLEFQLKCEEILSDQNYMMDPLRLSQIITNLVVNAIKYTEKGSITLQAAVISGPEQSILEVQVTDSGAGINKANLTQINEGIFDEGTVISGRYGSYGLGLSIVKKLVNLLAGRFEATSSPGIGSCFKFEIPVVKAKDDNSSLLDIETDTSPPPSGW